MTRREIVSTLYGHIEWLSQRDTREKQIEYDDLIYRWRKLHGYDIAIPSTHDLAEVVAGDRGIV